MQVFVLGSTAKTPPNTDSRVDTTLEWIAERFTRQARLPPAFDPVIDETHPEWPALRRYQEGARTSHRFGAKARTATQAFGVAVRSFYAIQVSRRLRPRARQQAASALLPTLDVPAPG